MNQINDWVQDTTATDGITQLQQDMAVLRNYTAVFANMIVKRFDKEFLIQATIAELGAHIASYDAAIWRLVSGHRLTLASSHSRWSSQDLGEMDKGPAPGVAFWGRGPF